jgi:hypothetical protein
MTDKDTTVKLKNEIDKLSSKIDYLQKMLESDKASNIYEGKISSVTYYKDHLTSIIVEVTGPYGTGKIEAEVKEYYVKSGKQDLAAEFDSVFSAKGKLACRIFEGEDLNVLVTAFCCMIIKITRKNLCL